jgi:hypothetical protein
MSKYVYIDVAKFDKPIFDTIPIHDFPLETY